MPQEKRPSSLELLLLFGSFLLSNLPVLFATFWTLLQTVLFGCVLWVALAVLAVWILKRQGSWSEFFGKIKQNWVLFPFLLLSGLSIFWSVYWEVSLLRWLSLLCTLITGICIGLRYDLETFKRMLSVFGIYILILCSIAVFLVPFLGIMNYHTIQGAWKGIYWHKNHMGLIAAFINILFLTDLVDAIRARHKKRTLFWGLLYGFSLFFIYQTDSVAAYITTLGLHGVLLLALLWLKFRKRLRPYHYWLAAAILSLAVIALLLNVNWFFGIFNRNTTLTGRIPMWTYLFNTYLSKRPWLGYGFNAFWYPVAHRVDIQSVVNYPDPIVVADNGFIDLLINTGYCGLFLFAVFYLEVWRRSLRFAAQEASLLGIFPVLLMTFTLLANVSWSLIFENEGFFMLLMFSILVYISDRRPVQA